MGVLFPTPNPYPGRGFVVGGDPDGNALRVVYWLMGRSASSRARRMAREGTSVVVGPSGERDQEHPELIYYRALAALPSAIVVTNGDQTDTVVEALEAGGDARAALLMRGHETDPPHFTPRVSAVLSRQRPLWALLSRIAAADSTGATSRYDFYHRPLLPGVGWVLHTYEGDGDPLPPTRGEPRHVPIGGTLEAWADTCWAELDAERRVALVAARFPLDTDDGAEFVFRS